MIYFLLASRGILEKLTGGTLILIKIYVANWEVKTALHFFS